MGSVSPPNVSSLSTTDSTYPRVRLAKLNAHWPSTEVKFDRTTGEFTKWSIRLEIFLQQSGLDRYIFGKAERLVTEPDRVTEPVAHANWLSNNDLIIGVIRAAISDAEQEDLNTDGSAKECYDALKARAHREGPVKQVALIREALLTYVPVSEPLDATARKICDLVDRAFAIGTIDKDLLKCIALLNSINDKSFESVQTQVSRGLADASATKPYASADIRKLFQTIDSLATLSKSPVDTALAAKHAHNHGPGQLCCTVCFGAGQPCRGHTKEWCIRPGGGMAGKTIEESVNARRATRGGGKPTGNSKTASGNGTKNNIAVKGLDGQAYVVDISHLQKLQLDSNNVNVPKTSEFAGIASSGTNSTEFFEYHGFMAVDESLNDTHTSIDWAIHANLHLEAALTSTGTKLFNQKISMPSASLLEKPFYIDSGATVHISPYQSDFFNLQPIPPRPVKGVGGSSIQAVGIGTIRLQVHDQTEIVLENALYIPNSTVRLISVSALAIGAGVSVKFDQAGVTIIDSKNKETALASGPLIPGHRLYTLNMQATLAEHALITQRSPDLTTWHWRLGHANYQTIVTMARAGILPGTLSISPPTQPKCDLCILGKQTKSLVPKVQEDGHRAMKKLQIVWIDLAGPMHVQSRTGSRYIMDIVDDFSNMPWSIPLKSKSDALAALQAWERARYLETGQHVGTYHTGHDGELTSHEAKNWLKSIGSKHEFGAPYMSEHMGRIERMHRTLQGKARTMRIAAKCPDNLWDEFYLTAAHLHAKTGTKSLNGRTPFEMWYDRIPDYSYMREIGCRAFILIQNEYNPKLNARGIECILIGYGQNSKTYRCYEPKSRKIYESYHVRFLERHDGDITLAESHTIRNQESGPTSIDQIQRISTPTPPIIYSDDDDDIRVQTNPIENTVINAGMQPEVNVPPAAAIELPVAPVEPRRSSHIPVPSAKTRPENHPMTQLECAVQESREAGERLRLARAERQRGVAAAENAPDLPENQAEAPNIDGNDQPPEEPDLANITTMEEIEHLLAAVEALSDPITLEADDEPRTWKEAQESADARQWEEAYREELRSLKEMGVYQLVPREDVPSGHKVQKGRPVFKIKRDENGKAVRFKVRLVFKGYEQVYGKDYTKTTSPTARMESWRVLLHIAATKGWDATQIDVKTAFLYGLLPDDEVQYMQQPNGFEEAGKETWVWCLVRGLYGMKQASRIWNHTVNDNMLLWEFTRLACESCVYYRSSDSGTVIAALHVDNFLSIASSKAENDRFKEQLRTVWTISNLGLPRFVVGIAVERDRDKNIVRLSQTALIDKIISQFGQADAAPVSLPMDLGLKLRRVDRLSLPQNEQLTLQKTLYRPLIGCLLYLAISTCPDIAYAVQQLSQFVDTYSTIHWNVALRLVQYLKGTRDLKLVLGRAEQGINLVGFTDSNWANCLDTRRSVGGYAWSLGSGAISWAAHKQKTITASSCKAEYMAAFESAQECIWLRSLLKGIGHAEAASHATPILCDNNAAINLSEDPTLHSCVKHVDIKYHFLRERVQSDEICIRYINTKYNVADLFTKALPGPLFICLCTLLGLK